MQSKWWFTQVDELVDLSEFYRFYKEDKYLTPTIKDYEIIGMRKSNDKEVLFFSHPDISRRDEYFMSLLKILNEKYSENFLSSR